MTPIDWLYLVAVITVTSGAFLLGRRSVRPRSGKTQIKLPGSNWIGLGTRPELPSVGIFPWKSLPNKLKRDLSQYFHAIAFFEQLKFLVVTEEGVSLLTSHAVHFWGSKLTSSRLQSTATIRFHRGGEYFIFEFVPSASNMERWSMMVPAGEPLTTQWIESLYTSWRLVYWLMIDRGQRDILQDLFEDEPMVDLGDPEETGDEDEPTTSAYRGLHYKEPTLDERGDQEPVPLGNPRLNAAEAADHFKSLLLQELLDLSSQLGPSKIRLLVLHLIYSHEKFSLSVLTDDESPEIDKLSDEQVIEAGMGEQWKFWEFTSNPEDFRWNRAARLDRVLRGILGGYLNPPLDVSLEGSAAICAAAFIPVLTRAFEDDAFVSRLANTARFSDTAKFIFVTEDIEIFHEAPIRH